MHICLAPKMISYSVRVYYGHLKIPEFFTESEGTWFHGGNEVKFANETTGNVSCIKTHGYITRVRCC